MLYFNNDLLHNYDKYLVGCTLYDFYCYFLFSKYKIKNLAVLGLFLQKMAEILKLSQKLPS